jgi:Uncharacterized protein conserved in bacteria (DUF2188)
MGKGDIHTVHRDGRWYNEVEGGKRAPADTKAEAQKVGREMARDDRAGAKGSYIGKGRRQASAERKP